MDYGCIEGYLAKKLAGKLNETLLRSPSTLIIDGDAWSGYLLRSDHVFGLEFGGNYDMIHQAICYEVERLLACKLQLIFVFSNNICVLTEEQGHHCVTTAAVHLQRRTFQHGLS